MLDGGWVGETRACIYGVYEGITIYRLVLSGEEKAKKKGVEELILVVMLY